jgi:chromosome segregation ATPase
LSHKILWNIALPRKVKEVLEFQNKSASTIHNLSSELQQGKLVLASALAESSDRERNFEQANSDLVLQKQSVKNTLNEILRELKEVKGQLATAQSEQSNNFKDVVQQLNDMTNERKSTAQELANMTHDLSKKEAEHQNAKKTVAGTL